jgi:hypothetical protein
MRGRTWPSGADTAHAHQGIAFDDPFLGQAV